MSDVYGQVKPSFVENQTFEEQISAIRSTDIPSNLQMKISYTGRTDSQPVYIGYAPRGLSASSKGWLLQKYSYESSSDNSRSTGRTIAYDSWNNAETTASYA